MGEELTAEFMNNEIVSFLNKELFIYEKRMNLLFFSIQSTISVLYGYVWNKGLLDHQPQAFLCFSNYCDLFEFRIVKHRVPQNFEFHLAKLLDTYTNTIPQINCELNLRKMFLIHAFTQHAAHAAQFVRRLVVDQSTQKSIQSN